MRWYSAGQRSEISHPEGLMQSRHQGLSAASRSPPVVVPSGSVKVVDGDCRSGSILVFGFPVSRKEPDKPDLIPVLTNKSGLSG
jgi:hypothetical protein